MKGDACAAPPTALFAPCTAAGGDWFAPLLAQGQAPTHPCKGPVPPAGRRRAAAAAQPPL